MLRAGAGRRVEGAVIAAAAVVAGAACSTTAAEVHGPTIGIGIELDHDLDVSPRIQVGYDYDYWYDMAGWGGGGGIAWSPVTERFEFFGEARVYAAPFVGFPLTPLAFGIVAAWTPELRWGVGPRIGLSGNGFLPPDACWPPLEGPWEGCPPGVYTSEDVVYPSWLPRASYRFHALFSLEREIGGEAAYEMIHILSGDFTAAASRLRWR